MFFGKYGGKEFKRFKTYNRNRKIRTIGRATTRRKTSLVDGWRKRRSLSSRPALAGLRPSYVKSEQKGQELLVTLILACSLFVISFGYIVVVRRGRAPEYHSRAW